MKFAFKLSVCTTLLIAVVLALGGVISVSRNFTRSMEYAVSQNVELLSGERHALVDPLQMKLLEGEDYSDELLAQNAYRLAENTRKYLGVYSPDGKRTIYTSLPAAIQAPDIQLAIERGSNSYLIRRIGGNTYMLLSTPLEITDKISARLLGVYDISQIIRDRDRQIRSQLLLNGLLIVIAAAIITGMSLLLTRPIGRLGQASRKIAAGAYGERTNIKSRDEIGELSQSFDRMAAAVEQTIGELGEELHRRDDFIAAFSHEIKTPMTAVIGYAGILRRAPCDEAKQLKYADIIYRESKRLEALSHKLMDIMKLTDENITLEPLEIAPLVRRLAEQIAPSLEGLELVTDVEDSRVLSQETLLDSLLRNLVVNAQRAEPQDGLITLTGRKTDHETYVLSVTDTGCGIPAGDVDRVTEAFYMVDKSRSRAGGGAGLGLYLCSRIAAQHGTALRIDSREGEGTVVSLEIEGA